MKRLITVVAIVFAAGCVDDEVATGVKSGPGDIHAAAPSNDPSASPRAQQRYDVAPTNDSVQPIPEDPPDSIPNSQNVNMNDEATDTDEFYAPPSTNITKISRN
jgi:hypothetical protein